VTDWVCSSASVDASGTELTAGSSGSFPSWNGIGNLPLASGGGIVITNQIVKIQPTPMASTPSIGRLRLDEIRGRIYFTTPASGAASSGFQVAVGIYVAHLNVTTTKWEVRNPLNLTDVGRDDYLYLQGKECVMTGFTTPSVVPAEMPYFELSIPNPIIIGGGQAVNVTVAVSSYQSTSIEINAFFRARIGPVA